MKKLISMTLAFCLACSLSVPVFASNQTTAYPFSKDIIHAEVSDAGIQPFDINNIIVMTEEEALQLGTELQSIAQNSKLVYITGDVSPTKIANSAGIPTPGEAIDASGDGTVKDIALALKYEDGNFVIDEIAIKSNNLNSLLNSKKTTVLMDGIKAALIPSSGSEVASDTREIQPYALPTGYDMYSNKETTVYDSSNNAIGTLRFNARYYERGSWTSGNMFDTIVKATFAPEYPYKVTKVYVTLGHLSSASKYADHEIIDETYIPSSGSSTTYNLGLDASVDELGVSAGASWSYSSEAIDVTNDFTESDCRIWTFEPVNPKVNNSVVQEPGIRSVATSSGKKYTSIKLSCPFYGTFGNVIKENTLNWNISW